MFRFISALSFFFLAIAAYASGPVAIQKADPTTAAFYKSGSSVYVTAGDTIIAGGVTCSYPSAVAVSLPTLVAGTDYQIVIDDGCDLDARTYAASLATGEYRVGGFHFLPGSYPSDHNLGGNTTPTILEYSIWDVAFRPTCSPLGMSKIGHAPEWLDIYFLGNSSNADGVSRNNDTILTGTNPPERADDFGGYGTSKYAKLNWWSANEFVAQWGKHLPSYSLMTRAAFGAQEGKGRGNHPVTTGFATTNGAIMWSDQRFTGKFGQIQVIASIWLWTSDFSDWEGTPATGPYGWDAYDVTEGRGQLILQNSDDLTALLFGGKSGYEEINGTRTTETIEKLWDNSVNIGIRGACDHYTQF